MVFLSLLFVRNDKENDIECATHLIHVWNQSLVHRRTSILKLAVLASAVTCSYGKSKPNIQFMC